MNSLESESTRRTRWQCRRGMLELDILLSRFLDEHYSSLSASELACFHRLLEQSDTTLLAWLQGQEQPPSGLKLIFQKVTQHIDY